MVMVVCTRPEDGAALGDDVAVEERECEGGIDRSAVEDADVLPVALTEGRVEAAAEAGGERLHSTDAVLEAEAAGDAELVTALLGGGDACGERVSGDDALAVAVRDADDVGESDARVDGVALALRVAESLVRAERETDTDCVAVRERAAVPDGERDSAEDAEAESDTDGVAAPVRDAEDDDVTEPLASSVAVCVATPEADAEALMDADRDGSKEPVASGALAVGQAEGGGDALEHPVAAAGEALALGVVHEAEAACDADNVGVDEALPLPLSVAAGVGDTVALAQSVGESTALPLATGEREPHAVVVGDAVVDGEGELVPPPTLAVRELDAHALSEGLDAVLALGLRLPAPDAESAADTELEPLSDPEDVAAGEADAHTDVLVVADTVVLSDEERVGDGDTLSDAVVDGDPLPRAAVAVARALAVTHAVDDKLGVTHSEVLGEPVAEGVPRTLTVDEEHDDATADVVTVAVVEELAGDELDAIALAVTATVAEALRLGDDEDVGLLRGDAEAAGDREPDAHADAEVDAVPRALGDTDADKLAQLVAVELVVPLTLPRAERDPESEGAAERDALVDALENAEGVAV